MARRSRSLDESSFSRCGTQFGKDDEPNVNNTNPFRNSPNCVTEMEPEKESKPKNPFRKLKTSSYARRSSVDTADERCNLLIVKLSQVNNVNLKLLEALQQTKSSQKEPKLVFILEEIKGILLCLLGKENTCTDGAGKPNASKEISVEIATLKQKHREEIESMRRDINHMKQNIVSLKNVVSHWKEVADTEVNAARTSSEEMLKCKKEFDLCKQERNRLENKLKMRNDQLEETLESIKIGKDINARLKDQLTKLIQIQEESMRTQSPSITDTRTPSKKSEQKQNNSEKLKESIFKIRNSWKVNLPNFKHPRKSSLKQLLHEMTVFANKLIHELEEKEDILRTQKKTEQKLEGLIIKNMRYTRDLEARLSASKSKAIKIRQ